MNNIAIYKNIFIILLFHFAANVVSNQFLISFFQRKKVDLRGD
jgi:hypothetical protein